MSFLTKLKKFQSEEECRLKKSASVEQIFLIKNYDVSGFSIHDKHPFAKFDCDVELIFIKFVFEII